MLLDTKEKQDLYVHQSIKNLVNDEVNFNIANRKNIVDWHHFKGIFDEEHEEMLEELEHYEYCINKIWDLTRKDAPVEAFSERVEIALAQGWQVLHEAVHMQAVLMKARKQLIKAPITDQSK